LRSGGFVEWHNPHLSRSAVLAASASEGSESKRFNSAKYWGRANALWQHATEARIASGKA
jgi:hypothetical protein